MVLASAQRCLPSLVFGPDPLPECIRQTFMARTAGPRHWSWDRFDLA
jgi:hypothetical protein